MLKEKNILITGGNSGIGLFATINLLKSRSREGLAGCPVTSALYITHVIHDNDYHV